MTEWFTWLRWLWARLLQCWLPLHTSSHLQEEAEISAFVDLQAQKQPSTQKNPFMYSHYFALNIFAPKASIGTGHLKHLVQYCNQSSEYNNQYLYDTESLALRPMILLCGNKMASVHTLHSFAMSIYCVCWKPPQLDTCITNIKCWDTVHENSHKF